LQGPEATGTIGLTLRGNTRPCSACSSKDHNVSQMQRMTQYQRLEQFQIKVSGESGGQRTVIGGLKLSSEGIVKIVGNPRQPLPSSHQCPNQRRTGGPSCKIGSRGTTCQGRRICQANEPSTTARSQGGCQVWEIRLGRAFVMSVLQDRVLHSKSE